MTGGSLIGGYATGLPVQIPMIDIQEVGTGGGSIARAGACRGAAGRPGKRRRRAGTGLLRAGRCRADGDRRQSRSRPARRRSFPRRRNAARPRSRQKGARDKIAKPLALDVTAAAEGIIRVATTRMSHVVRWVTTERGLDAADFVMVAYGGAGPLHAAMVAREIGIAKVIIPRAPGTFLRFGMLVADLRRDFVIPGSRRSPTASLRRNEGSITNHGAKRLGEREAERH